MTILFLKSILSIIMLVLAVVAIFTMFEILGRGEKRFDIGKLKEYAETIGGREQIRVDSKRDPRPHFGVLVDSVRPDDLLRRRHAAGQALLRPFDEGLSLDR